MGFLEPTAQYAAAGALVMGAVVFLLFQPTSLVRWLQKKNYQYEVTFALYMLTPTEKFIFNSILFLTISMFTLASVLYLPNHIMKMARRSFYYFAGDAALSDLSWQAAGTLGQNASKASEAVMAAATDFAGTAYHTAVNTAAAAQEAVHQAAEGLRWE
ncbi:hypothetical protein EJ03DRAFT_381763 [Teratosphaeria nubilosa]|uniref:Uncharacterized protein n=1 Tax=Teratosphaeria nubilosa TaxID=161662 RepID=A0A6G1LF25_9PEZI|nr:hypothetical protein EJ03DRAFT_381763 [Teratosphaeria nubilosa]